MAGTRRTVPKKSPRPARGGVRKGPARPKPPGERQPVAVAPGPEELPERSLRVPVSRFSLIDDARAVLSRSSWGDVQLQQLSRACRALWAKLQATCPDLSIGRRLKPSEVAGDMTIGRKDFQGLFSVAAGAKDNPQVVWSDGTNELLVDIAGTAVTTMDGLVLVTIPVSCEETGRQTVQVTFATGSPENPAGLVFATDTVPKGPPEIVETWGEALVAHAWASLLRVLSTLAGVAGADQDGAGLVPAGLTADRNGVKLIVIARHAMDRVTR
jgi:hypothetical protein